MQTIDRPDLFKLVYRKESVMLMEYIIPSLRITVATGMRDDEALEERLAQLVQLYEDRFIVGFHQKVEKDRQKAWHDRHIKPKHFQHRDMVLLYDSKFAKHPGKLQMHWLGPYIINFFIDGGVVQLQSLDGILLPKLVNGNRLKPYRHDQVLAWFGNQA